MIELSIHKAYKMASRALDDYLFNMALDAEINGIKKIFISELKYDEINMKIREVDERNKALYETASNNNKGIRYEKEGRINMAIKYYEKNLEIGYQALHSYERLRIIYRKQKDWANVERVIRRKAEVYGYTEYQMKEEIFKNCKVSSYSDSLPKKNKPSVYPSSRKICVVNGDKIGKQINRIHSMFPEFDFYTSVKHDDMYSISSDYSDDYTTAGRIIQEHYSFILKLKSFRDKIKLQLDTAKKYEHEGRYDLACDIYESLVANGIENTEPYKRLIAIYKKAKLKDAHISILKQSIEFFSSVQQRQLEYVKDLMLKYDVSDIKGLKLSECKSVSYYNGAFILYKKYNEISTWKSELKKMYDINL